MSTPLIELPPGRVGRLCAPADGRVIPRRLQDLGFVPGTPSSGAGTAGDQVEIEIHGYRLPALRPAHSCGSTTQLEAIVNATPALVIGDPLRLASSARPTPARRPCSALTGLSARVGAIPA